MSKAKEAASNVKEVQYNLKKTDLQMIATMQNRHNQELSNFVSYIALERFNYPVTVNTQFSLENGMLTIKEAVPEEKKEETVSEA